MALDDHGKLAAATIAFYVPYFAIALFLTLRHGFRRDAGWIFLLIFSLGMRHGLYNTLSENLTSSFRV